MELEILLVLIFLIFLVGCIIGIYYLLFKGLYLIFIDFSFSGFFYLAEAFILEVFCGIVGVCVQRFIEGEELDIQNIINDVIELYIQTYRVLEKIIEDVHEYIAGLFK